MLWFFVRNRRIAAVYGIRSVAGCRGIACAGAGGFRGFEPVENGRGRLFNPARAYQLKKLNLIRPLADSKIKFGEISVF